MKYLGEAKKIQGMEINKDREGGKICLTQKQYLKKVLQCFDISNKSKHVSTPLASHMKLNASLSPSSDEKRACISRVPYTNVVGSLVTPRPGGPLTIRQPAEYM